MLRFFMLKAKKLYSKVMYIYESIFKNFPKYMKSLCTISGPLGILDDSIIYFNEWSLSRKSAATLIKSSLSDTSEYNEICRLAADSDQIFKKFARNKEYRAILEHVNRDLGFEYINLIKNDSVKQLIPFIKDIEVGKPFKYHFRGYGRIPPTYLRYLKVLDDLLSLFGNLDFFNISEIGAGYGGQAVVIDKLFKINSYKIYDLPSACNLIKKYTSEIKIKMPLDFPQISNDNELAVDLVISNYAFSELNRDYQNLFLNKVILNSKRGYVTYNHIVPDNFDSMNVHEFASKIAGARVLAEAPLSFKGNFVVVWG